MHWSLVLASAVFGYGVLRLVLAVVRAGIVKSQMPPGPPGVPLLGNMLQLGKQPWLKYAEWSARYGPIFSLNLAGQPVVVINNFETAGDLLDRRSKIYSGRPRIVMGGEVMTESLFLPLMQFGEPVKKLRRAIDECLRYRITPEFKHRQEQQSALLVSDIIRDPSSWERAFRRSIVSFVYCTLYGIASSSSSISIPDRIVKDFEEMTADMTRSATPGAYLVDIFPSLMALPSWMAPFKQEGRRWFQRRTRILESLIEGVQDGVKSGTLQPDSSFCAKLLANQEKFGLAKRDSAWLAGAMMAASETTSSTTAVFMLAMTLHPDAVRQAHEDLDRVVGRDRMPSLSDRANLPYIDAIVKEVNRWRPVGPMGLPRMSTEDDWYNGYLIPKGTTVISNVWSMNRDPAHFPDYDDFRPSRFLDASGQLSDDVPDTHHQGHMGFGSGRRICPGKEVANQALFIEFATFLWAFTVSAPLDEKGERILPSKWEFQDQGLALLPAPFKCVIEPRFKDVQMIVASVIGDGHE